MKFKSIYSNFENSYNFIINRFIQIHPHPPLPYQKGKLHFYQSIYSNYLNTIFFSETLWRFVKTYRKE